MLKLSKNKTHIFTLKYLNMRYLVSVITLSTVILFSCSSMKKKGKTNSNANELAGTTWTIKSIPSFTLEKYNKVPTLTFMDTANKIGGNGGCNGFGGEYTVDGKKLKLEKIIATMMACMEGSKTENKLMQAYQETDNYEIVGDVLKLKKGTVVLAEFSRSKKD